MKFKDVPDHLKKFILVVNGGIFSGLNYLRIDDPGGLVFGYGAVFLPRLQIVTATEYLILEFFSNSLRQLNVLEPWIISVPGLGVVNLDVPVKHITTSINGEINEKILEVLKVKTPAVRASQFLYENTRYQRVPGPFRDNDIVLERGTGKFTILMPFFGFDLGQVSIKKQGSTTGIDIDIPFGLYPHFDGFDIFETSFNPKDPNLKDLPLRRSNFGFFEIINQGTRPNELDNFVKRVDRVPAGGIIQQGSRNIVIRG